MTLSIETTPVCASCGDRCERGYAIRYGTDDAAITTCLPCDRVARFAEYAQTRRVTTSLMIDGEIFFVRSEYGHAIPHRDAVLALHDTTERVQAEARRFDRDVWFGGLQPIVRACRTKSMRATTQVPSLLGPITVSEFSMAGRATFTFETATCEVTLITAEDEPECRMGLQSISATEAEAVTLIRAVVDAWKAGTITMVSGGTEAL